MDTDIKLALDRILVDPSTQPRVGGLDADHVAELQENPDAWPPLVVVEDDGYKLVDGFHRYAAAQNLGLHAVPVKVLDMPADGDLRSLAFALNAVHGKALTVTDRREEAKRLLRADAIISSLEIARRAGVSPSTVTAYRNELVSAGEIDATEQRVSRSGIAYTPPVARPRGELPAECEPLAERLFSPKERREQRRLARYFERLAVALDDQFDFESWQGASDAAEACCAVLGSVDATELGSRLGPAARNVLDVALALGYQDEP